MTRPRRRDYDSRFQWFADATSYGMGTPQNIGLWIFVIGMWVCCWALLTTTMTHLRLLPGWATSNEFNFPLNTGTSVAELFIGFLVGTAASRGEQSMRRAVSRIEQLEQRVLDHVERVEMHLGMTEGEGVL